MKFPAAAELERREADRREAHRDRKWTRTNVLIVAGMTLLAALLGSVITALFTK
jgi:uncharacterized membrane protein SpoIIM required for sporulation